MRIRINNATNFDPSWNVQDGDILEGCWVGEMFDPAVETSEGLCIIWSKEIDCGPVKDFEILDHAELLSQALRDAQIAHRKAQHGCYDAYCPMCES